MAKRTKAGSIHITPSSLSLLDHSRVACGSVRELSRNRAPRWPPRGTVPPLTPSASLFDLNGHRNVGCSKADTRRRDAPCPDPPHSPRWSNARPPHCQGTTCRSRSCLDQPRSLRFRTNNSAAGPRHLRWRVAPVNAEVNGGHIGGERDPSAKTSWPRRRSA